MRWSRLGTALAVVAGTLALGAPGSPTPSVSAAPNDIIAVVIDGTGYGHGRGMSQWGAYGWAVDEGKSWQWILDHYYGGTTLSDVATAQTRIRVRLTALDGKSIVGVTSHSGNVTAAGQTRKSIYANEVSPNRFQLYGSNSTACPTSSALTVPNGPIIKGSSNDSAVRQIQLFLNAYRISGDATLTVDGDFGNLTEARLKDWQRDQALISSGIWDDNDAARARSLIGSSEGAVAWVPLGSVIAGPITFTNTNSENSAAAPTDVLGVCGSSGRLTHYRGEIEVHNSPADNNANRVVNDIKTEDYLRGVVSKEISPSWADAGGGKGRQAVRAQAVAARSYGLQQNRYTYATICDTQSCQVYGGAATRSSATGAARVVEDARTDAAIAATAGKVRTWPNGSIVATEFSASNGPRTAGGAFPSVDDAAGDSTEKNPNHKWTRILDADTLAARYGLGKLTGASMVEAASSVNRKFDGVWFNDIVLTGSSGKRVQIPAWTFRGSQGLKSPGFTVRVIRENTTSKSFGMIGDSVGESIAAGGTSEFNRLIDGTFASATISTRVGRCTTRVSCLGTSGVEQAALLPTGLDLVVVELGYNDIASTFASDIDAMMNALTARGVARVAWVNMADIRTTSKGSTYGPMNAQLSAAESRWSTLMVLDWNAASASGEARARWFADGVHLTTTGQAEFALWLRGEILSTAPSHYLVPPKQIRIPIVGQQLTTPAGASVTVPPSASAVAVNVTSVRAAQRSVVTVWPCESPRRETSNLNALGGDVVANNVVVAIDSAGEICLRSNTGTNLIVDVIGWFDDSAPNSGLQSVSPERIVDSRIGLGSPRRKVGPDSPLVIDVVGLTASHPDGSATRVPVGVSSVVINLTAVNAVGTGFLTVWPCAVDRAATSSLNYQPGTPIANGIVAAVDDNGQVCVHSMVDSDVVVDLQGWFGPTDPAFFASDPYRIVDTRIGRGATRQKVQPNAPLKVPISGATVPVSGKNVVVPTNAVAAVVNVVATEQTSSGFFTVWGCEGERPNTSNLNYVAGKNVANGVIAPVGPDGSICVYTHSASHMVVDIAGWLVDGYVAVTPERFVDTRYAIGPAPT